MWGYTVDSWIKESDGEVIGVNLTCDNGESQYLTLQEYVEFTKNRDERKDCKKEG